MSGLSWTRCSTNCAQAVRSACCPRIFRHLQRSKTAFTPGAIAGCGPRSWRFWSWRRVRPRAREAAPTAVAVDSPSVKTTEAGGSRGYDAAKSPQRGALSAEIKGAKASSRRRYHRPAHHLSDHPGRGPGPGCPGAPAEGGPRQEPFRHHGLRRRRLSGDEAQRAAFEASRIARPVIKRTDSQINDFVALPRQWVVERTFGWINRSRRLAKDFEASIASAIAWFKIACAFLIMRRLAR